MIPIPQAGAMLPPPQTISKNAPLSTGQQLESVFLAEMLKIAGVGKAPESFGGGAGEDQFASFLRDAQAREMVRAGGIGLAAHFEASISEVKT